MFTSRYLNNVLHSIHERALRLIYKDYELPFGRILEDSKQKNIHQENIESLAIEIYKLQAILIPPIMSDLFATRENNYNLGNFQLLESSHKRTVNFGTETISYIGPQIRNQIPERLRTLATLKIFEKEIKNGSMMPVHIEYAKCKFNGLTLLTLKCNTVTYFSPGQRYSNTTFFPFLLTETCH